MDRSEFCQIIAFLEAGCGKQLAADSVAVYFASLGHFPVEALRYAAAEALQWNTFPVFPQIGVLRQHARRYLRQQSILEDRHKRRQLELMFDQGRVWEELSIRLKRLRVDRS